MYKKITKWQKRLHGLIETIYDTYGDPYDFTLNTTMSNYPTDEDAHNAYNQLSHTMFLQMVMKDFPLSPTELERKAFERAETDQFPEHWVTGPDEPKSYIRKEQRIPYRMMAEYVDRKKKFAKPKPKRKLVKKCKCK